MATSIVGVCNLALSHVGNAVEIQNLTTENTNEANTCRRFFEQVRDEVFRDFPWPFARLTETLALIETDPTTEWAFSYRYPSDCVMFGRILGPERNETRQTRVPYEIGADGSGGLIILTDWENAQGEFQTTVTDPTHWPADFVQAAALLLASYIAPRLAGGDPYNLGPKAFQRYLKQLETAQTNAVNEEQPEELPDSEFIRARE